MDVDDRPTPGGGPAVSRRGALLCGAALAGLGAAAAGCSSSGGPETSTTPTAPVELGPATAVPVGGAKLFREQRLLVSQPSEGEFHAFSAVCTHAGCVLDSVEDGQGRCPCHGSRFAVDSGTAVRGPARRSLPAVPVRVRNGHLVAGPRG
ncbi:ubiquinol-cytochrome c reductase iron-sulfur subunit [Streptomyces sp. TR06-5]|uniref:QcrA and Rieske domain-containing protein n=1 Tax=unclassified Streptomyces TaxID=2593676 RepID=UPI0039A356ED